MTEEERLEIVEKMTPSELLQHWRFDPLGGPWVQGRVGDRLGERLFQFKRENPDEWVSLSKSVGW